MGESKSEKGVIDQLKDIREHLGIDKQITKRKEFKLPFNIRRQAKTITKKNKVLFVNLLTNGGINISIEQIDTGMINIGDKFHEAGPGMTWNYNNMPTLIQPEWSLSPITPKGYEDNHDKSDPEAIIIRAIEKKEAGIKKKFGGGMWIWIILGGIVVAYLLFGKSMGLG